MKKIIAEKLYDILRGSGSSDPEAKWLNHRGIIDSSRNKLFEVKASIDISEITVPRAAPGRSALPLFSAHVRVRGCS